MANELTCEILTGGLCLLRERGCHWWVQVKQRLPLVDLKGKRLAIGEQINLRNTDRWTVPAKREMSSLVGSNETEAAIG